MVRADAPLIAILRAGGPLGRATTSLVRGDGGGPAPYSVSGWIFLYPEDEDTRARGGRLRLLYEGNPMSMIVEAAGGASSTGTRRILEVEPRELHQRIGVIIGSRNEVERAIGYFKDPQTLAN